MGVKSLTEVRAIAQTLGISDIFSKTKAKLEQEISLKKAPEPIVNTLVETPIIVNDLSHPPSLDAFIARGLKYSERDGRWYMSFGERTDEGNLDVNELQLFRCAERIMG